jgi:uncharacterized membrane protein
MDTPNNQSQSQPNPAPAAPQGQTGPQKNTLMAVLAYLGILVVIPYIVAKNDPFVKFHIKQGVILFVIEVASWLFISLLPFLAPLLFIVNIFILVFIIIGIVNAVNGREKMLPWVGHLADKFSI